MLEKYSVTVKLTGGSVHNFNNADGTECNAGDEAAYYILSDARFIDALLNKIKGEDE